jgi:hypothetical protein
MKRRITATIGAAALASTILAASVATAAPPAGLEDYGSGATGTALELTLLGQELAFSRTGAVVTSAPQAAADGAALLVAGTPVPDGAPSRAPDGESQNEVCPVDIDSGRDIAEELTLLGLNIACVRTTANIENGAPASTARSEELSLALLGAPLSTTGPIAPITEPLLGGVRDLIGALEPIDEQLAENLGISLDALVNSIIDTLDDGRLLAVSVAPTASTADASAERGVVARSEAAGARIELFPDLPGGALITVTVGDSWAEVVRDPETGEAKADASPALVTVQANNQLLGILGEIADQLNVALGQITSDQLGCNDANPLADVLCIELAATRNLGEAELEAKGLNFGEGTVGIAANAVRVQVLRVLADQLGGPGVGISLAESAAAAGAAVELPGQPAPPSLIPDIPRELPRTGADGLPLAGLALLAGGAALGLGLLRRSSLV